MTHRIISTLVLWTLLIGCLALLGQHGAVLILTVAALLTQWEAYKMMERCGSRPQWILGLVAGFFFLTGFAYLPELGLHPLGGLAIASGLLIVGTLSRSDPSDSLPVFSSTAAGLMIPLMLGFFLPILGSGHLLLAVWVIATAKFTDVGALLVGLKFGRHAFSPLLSPKKTWEGVVGGVLVSALVSLLFQLLFSRYLPAAFTPLFAIWAALPIAVASIMADLFESALKRSAGVKDSGNLLPGLGGVFDLTDSLLLAAPVGFLVLSKMLGGF